MRCTNLKNMSSCGLVTTSTSFVSMEDWSIMSATLFSMRSDVASRLQSVWGVGVQSTWRRSVKGCVRMRVQSWRDRIRT